MDATEFAPIFNEALVLAKINDLQAADLLKVHPTTITSLRSGKTSPRWPLFIRACKCIPGFIDLVVRALKAAA